MTRQKSSKSNFGYAGAAAGTFGTLGADTFGFAAVDEPAAAVTITPNKLSNELPDGAAG